MILLFSSTVTRPAQTETTSSISGILSWCSSFSPSSTAKAWHSSPIVSALCAYVIQERTFLANPLFLGGWLSILLMASSYAWLYTCFCPLALLEFLETFSNTDLTCLSVVVSASESTWKRARRNLKSHE